MAAPSSAAATQRGNALLQALPEQEREELEGLLQPVDLAVKAQVYAEGQRIEHTYFPLDAVMSVVAVVDGDTGIEVMTVGREGMLGLPAFLGATVSPQQAFCQVSGRALRITTADLRAFLDQDGALHDLLHRYTQATMVFLARNVACNRLHSSEERCARWLLQTHDRVGSDTFALTQEFLAQMLGVRRATVSVSAGALARAGLIDYIRGRITVTDRAGLEAASCECYALIKGHFDALLPS